MLLIYDHDNVLHITNDRGLRWNYDKADKPQFSFDYDFLFYIEQDNLFEIELGDDTSIITDEQKSEIIEYINLLEPPLKLTLANQYIEDLQEQTIRRINFVYEDIACDVCRFPSSAEIMIAGREGSQDPRRQIARRIMEWTDFAHGLCERIVEELKKTLDEDLIKSIVSNHLYSLSIIKTASPIFLKTIIPINPKTKYGKIFTKE